MDLAQIKSPAYKIALIYLAVASTWIVFSDKLLSVFVNQDNETFIAISIIKGLLFILITTFLIYYLVNAYARVFTVKSARLEKSLEEKKLLLSELHHRVKNNLAIITALIELEMQSFSDVRIMEGLQFVHSRIFSIARIQEILYENSDFTNVPFKEYLEDSIESHFSNPNNKIEHFDIDLKPVKLNVNQAIPLALLTNELFQQINEKKKRIGKLSVSMNTTEEGNVTLQISFDSDIQIEEYLSNTKKYFTAELINVFISQIKLDFKITDDGEQKTLHLGLSRETQVKGPYDNTKGTI